jgi:hypothetical protein
MKDPHRLISRAKADACDVYDWHIAAGFAFRCVGRQSEGLTTWEGSWRKNNDFALTLFPYLLKTPQIILLQANYPSRTVQATVVREDWKDRSNAEGEETPMRPEPLAYSSYPSFYASGMLKFFNLRVK